MSLKNIIVNADKGRIFQVISNLLSNAIKFTTTTKDRKEKEIISVAIEKDEKNSEVIIRVKDTGQGIDPEILPRLFGKFVTKSSASGTGLGLFISKNIVEAHGGKIWATTNVDGDRTTFSFTLPLN